MRYLINQKLESDDYIYHILKTEICIGVPIQCFKVAYDTGSPYLILGSANTNAKFSKKIIKKWLLTTIIVILLNSAKALFFLI